MKYNEYLKYGIMFPIIKFRLLSIREFISMAYAQKSMVRILFYSHNAQIKEIGWIGKSKIQLIPNFAIFVHGNAISIVRFQKDIANPQAIWKFAVSLLTFLKNRL